MTTPTALFDSRLQEAARAIQACLDAALGGAADAPVTAAMRYAAAGGKRLRGFLVIESARLFGVEARQSAWAAAAIEAMHAYSLVHDDLPAMDDDDLRRGQPTVHVTWDEATAVLVGDGLQSLAFEMLSARLDVPDSVKLELISGLASAAGIDGMVLGQALDMQAESASAPLSIERITELQRRKTGALIEWSCTAGAIMGRADPKPLIIYARALGLAYQIADDILDATGNETATGKRLRKDAAAGKATFVSLLGLAEARARALALAGEAVAALESYGGQADVLRDGARFVVTRDR